MLIICTLVVGQSPFIILIRQYDYSQRWGALPCLCGCYAEAITFTDLPDPHCCLRKKAAPVWIHWLGLAPHGRQMCVTTFSLSEVVYSGSQIVSSEAPRSAADFWDQARTALYLRRLFIVFTVKVYPQRFQEGPVTQCIKYKHLLVLNNLCEYDHTKTSHTSFKQ